MLEARIVPAGFLLKPPPTGAVVPPTPTGKDHLADLLSAYHNHKTGDEALALNGSWSRIKASGDMTISDDRVPLGKIVVE